MIKTKLGERGTLVQELTKHIDYDEPPGLGARELASFILQTTAGVGGKEALEKLAVFKQALQTSNDITKVSQLLAAQPPPPSDSVIRDATLLERPDPLIDPDDD